MVSFTLKWKKKKNKKGDGFLKAKEVVGKIWGGQCDAITAESLEEAFCRE